MSVRSVGNVDLSIGLVTCPVKMVGIIDSHDRKGSMYHHHDDGSWGKVKMPKVCEVCEQTVPRAEIATGFEENGEVVMLTADEMETVAANTGASVDISRFVKADTVDPMLFANENIYRLVPDTKRGRQAVTTYLMLRKMLTEHGLVGVVQYVRWGRNRLGLLSVEPTTGALLIRNMMWPDELRVADTSALDGVDEDDIDARLVPVMESLVASMVGEWNPTDYSDAYTEQLNAAIEAKATGGEIASVVSGEDESINDVSDLLAKLEASIAAKAEAKAPVKKAAARKPKVA